MFAYVRYIEDGCKDIVPISYIKDFDSNCDNSNKIYWVRWQEDYFKGQILFLKEWREEVEEELSNRKHVAFPTGTLRERGSQKNNKNQKKAAEGAKKNNLMALLKERNEKKKLSPLCPPPSKKMREHILSDTFSEADDNDDDDGGVVPQKLFEDAKQKQRLYLKKFNDVSLQLQETKNKLSDQEKITAAVEAENSTLRALNIQLQQHLLKSLNSVQCNDPVSQSPEKALKIAESGCADEVGPSASPKGDEIHLGGEVRIRKETWSRIQNSTRDSLFVKELAVAMWGTKTLGERSLTGKECPTTKTTRQPLTPQKLHTLKGRSSHKVFVGCHFSLFWCDTVSVYFFSVCYKEWLRRKNLEETETQARWGKAGRFITEKIMDINKQTKKKPLQ
ncbi:BEN domain-containing protein 5-like isoform X3 [Micropterus dolomieu]|uniref:BEN domain-containing protein 5-like isoform X3 n=1 Tax=Micropterus dolomieu TaxID=147949 RepID=UPI001E8D7F46|nr:BEN domain-containing protein 5-like isoform X3 [Micropterus dolomieu]